MQDIAYHNELSQASLEAELHKALKAGMRSRTHDLPREANPWEKGTDHFEMWGHGWSRVDQLLRRI